MANKAYYIDQSQALPRLEQVEVLKTIEDRAYVERSGAYPDDVAAAALVPLDRKAAYLALATILAKRMSELGTALRQAWAEVAKDSGGEVVPF
jgi:hypothetical protein